jgi:peptidoglycan/xylan/chitin deacetylase (PgdA/CDA1 family)
MKTNFKRLLLAVILILALVLPGWAANVNYYVDSNAAPGGDGSFATPFDELADIGAGQWTALANAAALGDQANIWLKRNSLFSAGVWSIAGAGSIGFPILIAAYGVGQPPLLNPAATIAIQNPSYGYITFRGLKSTTATQKVLNVGYTSIAAGIRVEYCHFELNITQNAAGNANVIKADLGSNVAVINSNLIKGYSAANVANAASILLRNCRIYGQTIPVQLATGGTVDYDYCHFAGNKADPLATAGFTDGGHNIYGPISVVNPNKYLVPKANFSIDNPENSATWVDDLITTMAAKGAYKPTLGAVAYDVSIGLGGVTSAKLLAWHNAGIEVCSHSWSHQAYDTPNVLTLTHATATCELTGGHLILSTGENIDLASASYDTVAELVAYLNGIAGYTCTKVASAYGALHSIVLADLPALTSLAGGLVMQLNVERMFRDEMNTSKAYFISILGAAGWANPVYIWPGGLYNDDARNVYLPDYYEGGRDAAVRGTDDLITGVDNARVPKSSYIITGAEAAITRRVRDIMYHSGLYGYQTTFYGHADVAPSVALWAAALDGIIAAKANYTTLEAINDYLRGLTNVSNNVWRESMAIQALDLRHKPDSVCINAGVTVAGVTATEDILGVSNKQGGGVDIGAYTHNKSGAWFGM